MNRHGAYDFRFTNGFVTSRACSMKSRATGLSVRFFNVMIPTGPGRTGNSIGSTLNDMRCGLNCRSDFGNRHKKFPVASKALKSGNENETALTRGMGRPFSLKASASRDPATLSGVGAHQGSSTSSASAILRRFAHRLFLPAATNASSLYRTSASRSSSGIGPIIRPIARSILRSGRSWCRSVVGSAPRHGKQAAGAAARAYQ